MTLRVEQRAKRRYFRRLHADVPVVERQNLLYPACIREREEPRRQRQHALVAVNVILILLPPRVKEPGLPNRPQLIGNILQIFAYNVFFFISHVVLTPALFS